MALGGGGRFAALESKLSHREGVTNPGALAAYIGRKKYGKGKFQAMAAKGQARTNRPRPSHGSANSMSATSVSSATGGM